MQAAAPLDISLLGELRVSRAGETLQLPPSRKTRALLAYLVLTGRPHRRERLCSLFWDVADDPRGALRWSLSKLRGLVDESGCRRIEADRDSVRFDPTGCRVDVLQLRHELERADLQRAPLEDLRRWAEGFRGELLEGLDLADFDDYQAWCVAEREEARRLRVRILAALSSRLKHTPEQALAYARARVQADPLEPEARIELLRLLVAAGRREEAEQHYAAGRRVLEELGSERAEGLIQAWGDVLREPAPAAPATAQGEAPASPPDPSKPAAMPSAELLVGRDAERAQLVAALDEVAQHPSARLQLVVGEPGVGKSRLFDILKQEARARRVTVLAAAAYEAESGRPYGPWIDALRGLKDQDLEVGAELAPLLPELGQAAEQQGSRDRLFGGVSDLVAVCAHEAPVLIAFDDVQWLDRASSELLHYVARTSRRRPVLLALAARAEELMDNASLGRVLRSLRRDMPVHEQTLEPLDVNAIEQLVAALHASLPAHTLHAQSGGNPLFALELLRGGGREGDQMPRSVADAVRDRLQGLSEASADVLRWGAVLGTGFTLGRLEALMAMDLDELVDALEALQRHALLRSQEAAAEQGYRFAHEVVRQAVYSGLSEPRRRLMHRKVASMLHERGVVDDDAVAEVAHHAALGHDDGLAAQACVRAAGRCLKVFANEQAVTLARRGLQHAHRLADPERVKRVIELKEIQIMASPRDEALAEQRSELEQLAERALDLGCNEHARTAFHVMSFVSWDGGQVEDARRMTVHAETAARQTSGPDRVRALAESARCLLMLERDLPHAHALLMEARARAKSLGEEFHAVADAHGMVKLHQGDLQGALPLFERARSLAEVARDRMEEYYALEHAAMLEAERENYRALARVAAQMSQLADKLREGSEAPFARAVCALARHGAGERAERELGAALEELRVVDAKQRLSFALIHAAYADLARGDAETARARASEALPLAQLLERATETLHAWVLLARASADAGDGESARSHRAHIERADWSAASTQARRRAERLLGIQFRSSPQPRREESWS